MGTFEIQTKSKRQIIDITEDVTGAVKAGSGLVNVFVVHTTAAITAADLDPGTDLDFLDFLTAITPQLSWRHPHNPSHAPDHLLASLIGPGVTVPVQKGKLLLGTWQRIILVELDGPRNRQLSISFINESNGKNAGLPPCLS